MRTPNNQSSEHEDEDDGNKISGNMKIVCSPWKLANTIRNLSDDHKTAIEGLGLGGLIHVKPLYLRRTMLVKIAKAYNIDGKNFHFGGKELEMTLSDVKYIMGLPVQGEDVQNRTHKPVDKTLSDAYKTNHKLKLNTLQHNITSSSIPDYDFKRQFVLYAIGIILAPTTKDSVDSKYLGLVQKVEDISKINWGQFTLNHLLDSIHTFAVTQRVNLQGNLAFLRYWYWEHVQAHSQYGISYSPIPPPVMARWDEANAKLRDKAYRDGKLDGGVVVMEIAVQTSQQNNNSIPGTTAGHNEDNHTHANERHHQQPGGHIFSNQQVDMILQLINKNQLDTEKKLGRIALDLDQKINSKILHITDMLAEIKAELKMEGVVQTRVSKVEDDLSRITTQLKDITSFIRNNAPETSKAKSYQEPSASAADLPVPKNPTVPPNKGQTLQNRTQDDAAPKHHIAPRKPVFEMDYSLTQEDMDVAYFLRNSYEDAEVVLVGDAPLTVAQLKRNVSKQWIYGQVINAFAYISNVETDATSFLTTYISAKLTGEGYPRGSKSRMVGIIANKCLGRHMLFLPLNVCGCHWILLVLNFIKEEVQVLDSLASNLSLRDEVKECALVSAIQACIDDAVEGGLVDFTKPINFNEWKKCRYTNIPQQLNDYSCGAFVMKYMLAWDGEKVAEHFTNAQVEVFSWKMCTRLLLSECNKHRLDSYKKVLTKKDYDEMKAKENQQDDPNDDHIEEIIDLTLDKNPKKLGSAKRKHGPPRKKQDPADPIVQQFSTETIVESVQKKTTRVSKPGPLQKSPYKQI